MNGTFPPGGMPALPGFPGDLVWRLAGHSRLPRRPHPKMEVARPCRLWIVLLQSTATNDDLWLPCRFYNRLVLMTLTLNADPNLHKPLAFTASYQYIGGVDSWSVRQSRYDNNRKMSAFSWTNLDGTPVLGVCQDCFHRRDGICYFSGDEWLISIRETFHDPP